MADKEVYIRDIRVGYATKVDVEPELSSNDVKTFDGPVVDGSEKVSYNVTVDKLRYGKISEYITLKKLLKSMMVTPEPVKVVERSKVEDGELKVVSVIYNCLVTTNKYTIDPESRTVENLAFKGSDCTEWINGEQI